MNNYVKYKTIPNTKINPNPDATPVGSEPLGKPPIVPVDPPDKPVGAGRGPRLKDRTRPPRIGPKGF